MMYSITWDSSIIPEIKHTQKMTAFQKDRNRPLLDQGNDAHLCPPWVMLGVGKPWTTSVKGIHSNTYQLLCIQQLIESRMDSEKEGKELSAGNCGERDFGSLWFCFCSCCRTLGIVLSVWSKVLTRKKSAMQSSCAGERYFAHMQKEAAQ